MKHIKLIKWLSISLFTLIVLSLGFIKTSLWFNDHQIIYRSPVKISFNKPVQVVKRELLRPTVIEVVGELPEMKNLTDIEKYICDKFGPYNCQVAIAVAKVEGLNHPADGFNTNTNNTIDVGYFRINSVHFKRPECSLDKVITPKGNIDCAYIIWQEQGWRPWVGYTSGNFINKLSEGK